MKLEYKRPIKLLFFFLLITLMLFFPKQTEAAVLKVHYHDTTYSYTGTQAKLTVDGEAIDLDDFPGLIIDNTALFSLEDVFKNALGAETSYDSESGEIHISGFGNEIILYLDSTVAYLNGEKQTLDTAPLLVKYIKAGETKILVPARFTAEALGFTYTWNASKKRSEITLPFQLYFDGTWINYTDIQGNVMINGSEVSLGKMPAIFIENYLMVPAKKVFSETELNTSYEYKEDTKQAIISASGISLTFTMDNKEVLINNEKREAPVMPRAVINGYNNTEYSLVPLQFIAEQLGFYYLWNDSTKTAELYTSENEMLEVTGYYFSEECSEEYSNYANTLPNFLESYHIEAPDTIIETTSISNIFYNDNTIPYGERYIISAEQPFGEINASFDKTTKQIAITSYHASSIDTSYPFDYPIIKGASSSYDSSTETTLILFQSSTENINYYISLSEDRCNLYLDIYENCLTSIVAQGQETMETLSLTGAMELSGSYTTANNVLTITFPYTRNGIAKTEFLETFHFIKGVSLTEQEDHSLVVSISYEGGYYLQVSGTKYQIIFHDGSLQGASSDFDIYIPLPSDVDFKDITDKDPYADKKFKLILPGDYISYYKKNNIISNKSVVKKISIIGDANDNTVITVQTTKIQGYHLYDAGSSLGVNLGSPKKMYQNIVLLDAGHGGKDSGAVHNGYQEKNFNLTILYKKMKQYFTNSSSIKAYWTRANDTFVNLYERPKISAKANADIFISLHMNSASSSSAKGLEVYYSKINKSKGPSGLTSEEMADFFQDSLISKIGCYDRGYKSAEYVVAKYNTVPAILIELGFMSNSTDLARLKDSQKQQKAAKALYDTIKELFEEYPTGR